MSKKWTVGLLIIYVTIILSVTVLFRESYVGQHFQPKLFWSYEVWEIQKKQIFENILLFIPLGVIAGRLWKWKGILIGSGVSLLVESLQLISSRGLFEFDDIAHNALGTLIGVSICMICVKLISKKGNKNELY